MLQTDGNQRTHQVACKTTGVWLLCVFHMSLLNCNILACSCCVQYRVRTQNIVVAPYPHTTSLTQQAGSALQAARGTHSACLARAQNTPKAQCLHTLASLSCRPALPPGPPHCQPPLSCLGGTLPAGGPPLAGPEPTSCCCCQVRPAPPPPPPPGAYGGC
jgi:hypothetical protein